MVEAKPKNHIVEDVLEGADMLYTYFHVQGCDVFTANRGEDVAGVKNRRIAIKRQPFYLL